MPISHDPHRHFAREKARKRRLELRVREEEDPLAGERVAIMGERLLRARARRGRYCVETRLGDAEGFRCGAQPERRAFSAERKRRLDPAGAALLQRMRRVGEEGLREKKRRAGADRRQVGGAAHGEEANRRDAQHVEEAGELVLDDIGERADDQQRLRGIFGGSGGSVGNESGETGVFALRERRLNAAARIAQNAHARRVLSATGARPPAKDRS